MIADLINSIPDMRHKSYLELGVGNGRNFEAVKCRLKTSVDVNERAFFTGTTDEYFAQLPKDKFFDVVFIDANHDFNFVLRDFNNAIRHCLQWILIHDLIPPSEKYTAQRFCSDSFRLLYLFWQTAKFKFYPMASHYGLAFVKMPAHPIVPDARCQTLTFQEFQEIAGMKQLYDEVEILRILNDNLKFERSV